MLGNVCGVVDPTTDSVCNKSGPHEVHKMTDESFEITWTTPAKIVLAGEEDATAA
jgi:hypothetical protein